MLESALKTETTAVERSGTKRVAVRSCVVCRRRADKRYLLRFVRTNEEVILDTSGKRAGRGAYVCPSGTCFEAATKRGRLSAALRTKLSETDLAGLERAFAVALDGRDGLTDTTVREEG